MAAILDQPHLDPVAAGPVDSASITPPQSANGKKDAPEGVPSELSDLELDSKTAAPPDAISAKQEIEEKEEIEPDHYYGGGKIPVFKPVSGACVQRVQRWKEYSIFLFLKQTSGWNIVGGLLAPAEQQADKDVP